MSLKINRIFQLNEFSVSDFNLLLDEGTEWNEEQGKLFLADSHNALFIASLNDKLVGFATAHFLQRFDKRRAGVLLYEIGVEEEFQRQGIGTALIEAVKDWAKSENADEIWVLTDKQNEAAQKLYESTGAKEESPGTMMFVYKV